MLFRSSGQGGRVTKKDILSYVDNRQNGTAPAKTDVKPETPQAAPAPTNAPLNNAGGFLSNIKEPVVLPNPGDEIVEMDRMRKLIAEHMIMSKHVSPHVTSYVEADVTEIVQWRDKIKKDFQKREGENMTFTQIGRAHV